ncbi:MAG: hypothetical protein AAGN82_00020 [Myxococcota bacterium]
MKRLMLGLVIATQALACTSGLHIDAPDGFAELEEQVRYTYRATNAKGVVLGVRREDNEPQADLAFWSGALDAHLRRRGYEAISARDVATKDGVEGRQIRYERKHQGRQHHYWVTVFVTPDQVVTVEAGGDEAFFEDEKKAIQNTIESLELG